MNEEDINKTLLSILGDIAPEADLSALSPTRSIRDQVDIDSMDYLNFLIAIEATLKVDVPERDYGRMSSMKEAVSYLAERLVQPEPTS
jgi:acyl carrier protein